MAKYIEQEETVRKVLSALVDVLDLHNTVKAIKIANKIREIPTADVVEVVRCKDCKHYKLRNVASTYKPSKPCCLRSAASKVSENDFCSFGERKEGTENGSK